MYYQISKSMSYKMTAVIAENDCMVVRILTPCLLPANSTALLDIFDIKSIKGRYFIYDERDYVCTHEIYLKKQDSLWKGGNHLIIYTTPDLAVNNLLAVARKEDIKHLQAVTIFAEILCADNNQSFREADCLVFNDPNGVLMTNFEYETLPNNIPFDFKVNLQAPDSIAKESIFNLNIYKYSFSGQPVNSNELIECLSGYIPNRIVSIKNGTATVKCSSWLVEDFCCVLFNNIKKIVKVEL